MSQIAQRVEELIDELVEATIDSVSAYERGHHTLAHDQRERDAKANLRAYAVSVAERFDKIEAAYWGADFAYESEDDSGKIITPTLLIEIPKGYGVCADLATTLDKWPPVP